jgi:hypothetical protein
MAEPHVVTALRAKRAEISGHVHNLERKLARHRANLAASRRHRRGRNGPLTDIAKRMRDGFGVDWFVATSRAGTEMREFGLHLVVACRLVGCWLLGVVALQPPTAAAQIDRTGQRQRADEIQ